ncbi:hypothetical protein [Halovenus halobia]|uniref:hypothetical protein n=1 Tax=Halovenus halobia TaxID=3396622 RepID=UPI003F55A4E5
MSRHDRPNGTHGQQQSETHHSQHNSSGASAQHRSRQQTPSQTAASSPSVGFRLVSALFATTGVVMLAAGAVLFDSASSVSAVFGPAGTAVLVIAVAFGGFGLTNLLAGYGTWRFRAWGRKLGLFVSGSATVGSLFMLVAAGPVGLPSLALNAGTAWYLYENDGAYARWGRA